MPIFGAIARVVGERQKGKKQIALLDSAIDEAEKACSQPIVDSFTGADRFDAAQRWLDATLAKRLDGVSASKRSDITENYLERMHQEFEMAKQDLHETTATRAEVVALGLATRELSLSFDSSLTTLKQEAERTLRASIRQAQEHLNDQLTNDLDVHTRTVAHRLKTAEQALKTQLNTLVSDATHKLNRRIDQAAIKNRKVLEGELNQSRESIRADLAKKSRELSAQLSGRADEIRKEQARHQARTDQQLETIAQRQQTFFDQMDEAKQQARLWLYGTAATSLVALGLAILAVIR